MSVVRTRPLPLDFPCLGLGNLAVSQPSCFLWVAWQLGTERVLQLNDSSEAKSARHPSPKSSDTSISTIKPRRPVYLASFSVRTLKQAGQQATLVLTLDSLGIDVCCVSETRIQDESTVVELAAPSFSTRFRLRTPGHPEAAAAECAGVDIVLSHRMEGTMLDWITVDGSAARLATCVEFYKWEFDRSVNLVCLRPK
ncbi:hypothetical protein CLF_111095 [Clonorchis sinensis]|uniref:Uncharacterized protein n=1 Tax=Clonorchis sinensis TaxID=79923 RepID=G7YUC5_CLOSI|nr:hypothetical protein CLF_111095 [Clonorchis sinensis]